MKKVSFLYIIGAEEDNSPVKIGISENPNSRIAMLQTGSSTPLHFYWVWVLPTEWAYEIEGRIHRILSKHRLTGEWFAANAETNMFISKLYDCPFPYDIKKMLDELEGIPNDMGQNTP